MQDYSLRIEITYRYDAPARASRSILRLLPQTLPGQEHLNGLVTSDPPPSSQEVSRDFFGNVMTTMIHNQPLEEITFRFGGAVRRWDPVSTLDLSTDLSDLAAEIAANTQLSPEAPHHFTTPSRRAMPDPAITRFVKEAIAGERSSLGAARRAAGALHSAMRFDPSATDVTTEPATAFAARSGVCQDFSHILTVT